LSESPCRHGETHGIKAVMRTLKTSPLDLATLARRCTSAFQIWI
jgi:hypothetical protein